MSRATKNRSRRAGIAAPVADPGELESLARSLLRQELEHPIPLKKLQRDIARQAGSKRDASVQSVLEALIGSGEVWSLRGGYYLAENLGRVERRLLDLVAAYHDAIPYEPAVPTGELKKGIRRSRSKNARRNIDPEIFERAMAACQERGDVVSEEAGVRLAGFTVAASERQRTERLTDALLVYIDERRHYRINLRDCSAHLGTDERRVKALLERALEAGELVHYADARYVKSSVLHDIGVTLAMELSRRDRLTTAEIKALLGIPRNAIIPLLERLDSMGFTRRDGDTRIPGPAAAR